MQWLNEPTHWSNSSNQIIVRTSPKTDFWRVTHYDFIRDTGHFYFEQVATDFNVEVKLHGHYRDLYDQAGIMIRADEQHWIKTGIEYVDGIQHLSAVVTRDYSDWSVIPLSVSPTPLQLRVERRKEAIRISYLNQQAQSEMVRLAYFPVVQNLQVGLMCASPDGDGFEVTFEDYRLEKLS
jgi:uncharacterized protein